MKVFISGSFWHGSIEESYARAFESSGWEVIRFDWDTLATEHPLAKFPIMDRLLRFRIAKDVGELFLKSIQASEPAFVFVIKGRWIDPDTLSKAKLILRDRPIANFNPDSPWERPNSSKRLLEALTQYDVHFIWNSHLKHRFKEFGAKSIEFLPFAYDPTLHFPIDRVEQKAVFDALFLGTYSEERDKLLSQLMGSKIGIWGNGWEQSQWVPKNWLKGNAIYGEDSTQLLDIAPVALNILRPQNAGSHNMRTFEIPATRHAMLTTRSEEQAQWFDEGAEMECYETPQELLEKIRELTNDPMRRRNIAHAGFERVREETYAKRVRQMLVALGFAC